MAHRFFFRHIVAKFLGQLDVCLSKKYPLFRVEVGASWETPNIFRCATDDEERLGGRQNSLSRAQLIIKAGCLAQSNFHARRYVSLASESDFKARARFRIRHGDPKGKFPWRGRKRSLPGYAIIEKSANRHRERDGEKPIKSVPDPHLRSWSNLCFANKIKDRINENTERIRNLHVTHGFIKSFCIVEVCCGKKLLIIRAHNSISFGFFFFFFPALNSNEETVCCATRVRLAKSMIDKLPR